jgi:hypothetical protein
MAKGFAGVALIAALAASIGMAAPAFAKHGNGNDRGWNGGSNPPGWSHGNKTGWGGRGMPPGLYKKFYGNSGRDYSNRYGRGYSNWYSGGSSSYNRSYWNYYGSPSSYYGY